MRASSILAQAEIALAQGDLRRARALVDAVLAEKPRHAGALELLRAIDELAPFHDPAEPVDAQDFGDLRPDARHAVPAVPAGARPLRSVRYDPREERPLGVSILAILDVALGAFTLFLGLLAGGPIGLLLDLAGAAFIAAGVGLWRLRPWAWTLSLVVTASGLVANLMQGLAGDGRAVFMALVQGALLAYLWAVRVHFGGRARARAPSNGSEA